MKNPPPPPKKNPEKSCKHKFPQQKRVYFLPVKCNVSWRICTSRWCMHQKLNSAMSDETNSGPCDGRLLSVWYNCIFTVSDNTENLWLRQSSLIYAWCALWLTLVQIPSSSCKAIFQIHLHMWNSSHLPVIISARVSGLSNPILSTCWEPFLLKPLKPVFSTYTEHMQDIVLNFTRLWGCLYKKFLKTFMGKKMCVVWVQNLSSYQG